MKKKPVAKPHEATARTFNVVVGRDTTEDMLLIHMGHASMLLSDLHQKTADYISAMQVAILSLRKAK